MKEGLGRLRFVSPLRCLDCKHRFVARTLEWADLVYSRCPICLRQDLNSWTGRTFDPPFWMAVKVAFGAHKWRCEYCRINFASFRKRKEIFTFSRWKKMSLPGLPEPAETLADLRKQEAAYVKARPAAKPSERWNGIERRSRPRDERDEGKEMSYERLRELAKSLKTENNREPEPEAQPVAAGADAGRQAPSPEADRSAPRDPKPAEAAAGITVADQAEPAAVATGKTESATGETVQTQAEAGHAEAGQAEAGKAEARPAEPVKPAAALEESQPPEPAMREAARAAAGGGDHGSSPANG